MKNIFIESDLYNRYKTEIGLEKKLFGILSEKNNFDIKVAKKDIIVHKILKVSIDRNNIEILTPIICKPINSELLEASDTNIEGYHYSEHLYYFNTKGIHSIPDNTIICYPHFRRHFTIKAIIPKGSEYIEGIDAYNFRCNVLVSTKLIVPKINIERVEYNLIKISQLNNTIWTEV